MTAARLVFALVLLERLAAANGRAPATNGVVFAPGDPATILVRSTLGLFVSHDSGCTFEWACEQNIGYGGIFDPTYAIAADGTIFATTFDGLRVSHDGACSFATATKALQAGDPDRLADRYVRALDLASDGAVWAATSDNGSPNDVYVSIDSGTTFASANLSSPTIFWESLKVAPSDARRIFVTGYELGNAFPDGGQTPPVAHLMRSDDRGATWNPMSLAGVITASVPQLELAAVEPAVFVISLGANGDGDRVYRSTGGAFAEVLATTAPITGFAARDASTVIVGTRLAGDFVSTDGGQSFGPLDAPPLACLGQRADGMLIGCSMDATFSIGQSTDGTHWKSLFQLHDLAGPLDCLATTPEYQICNQQGWRPLQQQLGAHTPVVCPLNVPDDAGVQPPPPARGGGCCDAGSPASALVALGVLAWLCRRRPVVLALAVTARLASAGPLPTGFTGELGIGFVAKRLPSTLDASGIRGQLARTTAEDARSSIDAVGTRLRFVLGDANGFYAGSDGDAVGAVAGPSVSTMIDGKPVIATPSATIVMHLIGGWRHREGRNVMFGELAAGGGITGYGTTLGKDVGALLPDVEVRAGFEYLVTDVVVIGLAVGASVLDRDARSCGVMIGVLADARHSRRR